MLRDIIFVTLGAIFLTDFTQSSGDYYWRDWNGTAPSDGFIAGTHRNESIYVAQAYVEDYGLYIGFISEGETTIKINTGATNESPLNTSSVLKVLCVQGDPVDWIKVTTDTIDTILEYYLPLVGGMAKVEYNRVVYVGKYVGAGDTFVGSVHSDLWLYYSNGSLGLDTKEYELLVRNF